MGQAKVKKERPKAPSKYDGVKLQIMRWVSCIYLCYITCVYVLYCPYGYVAYDYYKRNLLLIGTAVFAVLEVALYILSLDDEKRLRLNRYSKRERVVEILAGALLVSWLIGFLVSDNKQLALWGDANRMIGLLYMIAMLGGMILVANIGGWNRLNTIVLMGTMAFEFQLQVLFQFYIDPLGFNTYFNGTRRVEVRHLMATLANPDQNAMYDGIYIILAMSGVVLAKKWYERIAWGLLTALAMLGGMMSLAETFYFGLLAGFLVLFGYALAHPEYLKRVAVTAAWIIVGNLSFKYAVLHYDLQTAIKQRSTIQLLLNSWKTVGLMVAATILLYVIGIFYEKWKPQVQRTLWRIYTAVVCGGIAIFGAVLLWAATHAEKVRGPLALVLELFDSRVKTIGISLKLFKTLPFRQKLFGAGFGNFTDKLYTNLYEEVTTTFGFGDQLADSHNVLMDLTVRSGLIGMLLYVALFVVLIWLFRKAAKDRPQMIAGVAFLMGYVATGLVNFNLITVTPTVFVIAGAFLYMARKGGRDVLRDPDSTV